MMPTSDTCRSRRSSGRPASAGFTLLEMTVVLAILALVVGVAAVRTFSLVASWRAHTELQSIEAQFAHLPVLARQRGREIVLPPSADKDPLSATLPPAITLPSNWLIHFDHPLKVRASGWCEGATITLDHYDRRYHREVLAPFCQWRAIDQAP